jgi:hypothetical protein
VGVEETVARNGRNHDVARPGAEREKMRGRRLQGGAWCVASKRSCFVGSVAEMCDHALVSVESAVKHQGAPLSDWVLRHQ